MSTKRLKVTRAVIRSRAEAEAQMDSIRSLTIARNALQAARERRLKQVDDELGSQIDAIARELESRAELLRGWADENPSEFAGKKSLELTHGVIGWRIGQPSLKTLAGWTWDRVLESLRDGYASFIRRTETVDKAALIAARESLGVDELKKLGLRVVQDEPFFVEPKLEDAPEARIKEGV